MAAKPIRASIDMVDLYLAAKGRHELDSRLAQAYSGQADTMLEEVADLLVTPPYRNGRRHHLDT